MDFSLSAIWDSMGLLARSVALMLLVFAVASLGVFIERLLFFRKVVGRAGEFARASTPLLDAAKHEELLKLCRAHVGIPLAEIVLSGLTAYGKGVRDAAAGTGTEINVTPLVDVVLVLLIIFMVIAPQLERSSRAHWNP
jgi:hypothetical protein